jgi:hypothetical protein
MTSDFIALVLQAVGGAIADTANNNTDSDKGTHIMVAGLAFQVLNLLVFMAVAGAFAFKVNRHRKLERNTSVLSDRSLSEKVNGRSAGSFKIFLFGEQATSLLHRTRLTRMIL